MAQLFDPTLVDGYDKVINGTLPKNPDKPKEAEVRTLANIYKKFNKAGEDLSPELRTSLETLGQFGITATKLNSIAKGQALQDLGINLKVSGGAAAVDFYSGKAIDGAGAEQDSGGAAQLTADQLLLIQQEQAGELIVTNAAGASQEKTAQIQGQAEVKSAKISADAVIETAKINGATEKDVQKLINSGAIDQLVQEGLMTINYSCL